MGITDVFNLSLSDLSGMAGENALFITTAEHSAVIRVNEEGTEATAVTAVGCFPAGTEVYTSDGLVPIESIEKNNKVYAYDIDNSRWVEARDLEIGDILIDINGSSLQITGLSSRDEKLEVFYLTYRRVCKLRGS